MRGALASGMVIVLLATPAFAGDGNVPRGILSSLGLGEMQVISDAEGMQVRGQASLFGRVTGTSLTFGQLLYDPDNMVVVSSVATAHSSASTSGPSLTIGPITHEAFISENLIVTINSTTVYSGSMSGWAWGAGSVNASVP